MGFNTAHEKGYLLWYEPLRKKKKGNTSSVRERWTLGGAVKTVLVFLVLIISAAHRFLQVTLGQLAVLCVAVQHRAQLEVSPGLDPRGRLELKHCLQTVDAESDLWRTRRAEMFGKAQQSQIPRLRGLCARCHPKSSGDKNNNLPLGQGPQLQLAPAARSTSVICMNRSNSARELVRRKTTSGYSFSNMDTPNKNIFSML